MGSEQVLRRDADFSTGGNLEFLIKLFIIGHTADLETFGSGLDCLN